MFTQLILGSIPPDAPEGIAQYLLSALRCGLVPVRYFGRHMRRF